MARVSCCHGTYLYIIIHHPRTGCSRRAGAAEAFLSIDVARVAHVVPAGNTGNGPWATNHMAGKRSRDEKTGMSVSRIASDGAPPRRSWTVTCTDTAITFDLRHLLRVQAGTARDCTRNARLCTRRTNDCGGNARRHACNSSFFSGPRDGKIMQPAARRRPGRSVEGQCDHFFFLNYII